MSDVLTIGLTWVVVAAAFIATMLVADVRRLRERAARLESRIQRERARCALLMVGHDQAARRLRYGMDPDGSDVWRMAKQVANEGRSL